MANADTKQLYEGMYILSTTLSEDARKKGLEKITTEIESKGGEIHQVHDLGRKRLAYEIQGKRDGHYYVIYFSSPPSAIPEFWETYKLHEDLIRFMTLQTDKVLETIEFKPIMQS